MLSMDIQLYSVQIFLFYSPSQPFQIIITATNKVFTALQIAHHFQEDNGIIKEKRITFMSTSVVNFFLLETEIMGSLKMVDISLTENLLYNIFAFSRNERTHPNLVSQAREIEIFWTANWPPL